MTLYIHSHVHVHSHIMDAMNEAKLLAEDKKWNAIIAHCQKAQGLHYNADALVDENDEAALKRVEENKKWDAIIASGCKAAGEPYDAEALKWFDRKPAAAADIDENNE